MEIQLLDIIDFVKKYRGTSPACKDWTDLQIGGEINNALQKGCVCVDTDVETGSIAGVVICLNDKENKVLHIQCLLINKKIGGVLIRMLNKFYELFPSYTIQAHRNKKLVKYANTHRFCKLLEIISH